MLTKADDYPIHQLPIPVSEVGSERNFYDRYFFNGYNQEGDIFFAVALCLYPNLNIMDGSFVFVYEGIQHNYRYSRILDQERLNTKVGALEVQVIEPLKELRVCVEDKEKNFFVDLTFNSRFEAMQEPRMTMKSGPRITMDSTRLTQHGRWKGKIGFQEEQIMIEPETYMGSRDRSWGIRPVGLPDSQPLSPVQMPQFYWLWCPANFREFASHTFFVDDEKGNPISSHAVIQRKQTNVLVNLSKEVIYKPGTRRISKATFVAESPDGTQVKTIIEPKYNMFMCGLGYMHPEWGHGHFKGENESHYDFYDLKSDPHDPPFLHIQAISKIQIIEEGTTTEGCGVLEQLLIGRHKPSNFQDILDLAK